MTKPAEPELGYAERPTVELASWTQPTTGRTPETWWRWGYQVGGGNPVMVNEHCRSESQAKGLAQRKATEIREELTRMHVPNEVFWWIQRWQISTAVKYDKQETGPL